MDLEPLILLEDEPVNSYKADQLGLEPFARVIAGAAVGTGGPFTIGVFANWGEGKTSLLRQAKTLIDEFQNETVTVWFNAWQYENEEHPIVPLVASIVRAIEQKISTPLSDSADNSATTQLTAIARALRAVAYGFSAKSKIQIPGFADIEAGFVAKEMIDRYEKISSREDPLLERTLYYNAFEALEKITKSRNSKSVKNGNKVKVVVFMDDLDRCLPPQALKLLESIKLVLAQQGFVFVLAVDRRVLESFLAVRYQKEYGIDDYRASGTQYLDKIVQMPLSLPSHRSRFEAYIRRILDGPVLNTPSNKPVQKAVNELVEVLAAGSNFNPRNLVRFLNNLIVDRRIWIDVLTNDETTENRDTIDTQRLGLCAISRILRQHLGDRLYRWIVANDEICTQLATGNLQLQSLTSEEKSWQQRLSIEFLERLDESEFIRELLETTIGKTWLEKHPARRQVDEFLVQQREDDIKRTEVTVGEIYKGKVERIMDFGVFVEVLPGKTGLVHISRLADPQPNKISDICKEGDSLLVKVLEIDKQGRIRLGHTDALQDKSNSK